MRFFRDPAVVKPERPAAKPLTYRELYPEMFAGVARDSVAPVVTPPDELARRIHFPSPTGPCGGCGECNACIGADDEPVQSPVVRAFLEGRAPAKEL